MPSGAWANLYARHYDVQYWTGNVEPFYGGINKATGTQQFRKDRICPELALRW
jgi:hypothetical protein